MTNVIKDFYCDENDNILERHVYPSGEDWTMREASFLQGTTNRVYTIFPKGAVSMFYWDKDQFSIKTRVELPQIIQMALLIGAA